MAASAASSTQDKDPDSGLESTASVSSLSSSVNEQVEEPEVKRRKLIYFDQFADGTLKFDNGETVKISKTTLAVKSKIFQEMFLTATDNLIEIRDCSVQDFKIFLNCILGLEECTFDRAFKVLPIACKYEVDDFIEECVEILTPKEMNDKVCHLLNLATSCKCAELEKAIITFLVDTRYIYFLLSKNENFYMVLKPESMHKLLEEVDIDSYILRVLFNWGKNYLKNNSDYADLRSFLDETGISDFINVFSFKTAQDLIDFDESEMGAEYFTLSEINCIIKSSLEIGRHGCISWVDMKPGDVLVEKLIIKKVCFLSDHIVKVKVFDSSTVFYGSSETSDKILYKSCYTWKLVKANDIQNVEEAILDVEDYDGEPSSFSWGIDSGKNMISDIEIIVEHKFPVYCRILKASPKGFEAKERKDELFFTYSVMVDHIEKKINKKKNDNSLSRSTATLKPTDIVKS